MEAKGKTLLKVVSIILIIGGILSALASVIGMFGGGVLYWLTGESASSASADAALVGTAFGTFVLIYSIITLIMAVLQIIAGIKGVKNCANTSAADNLKKWGIILIAIAVISILLSALLESFEWTSIFSFLLPVLYTIGANMNKETV